MKRSKVQLTYAELSLLPNEAGKTRIRSHKYKEATVCQNVLGYDDNALYHTAWGAMPCGKEIVIHWPQIPGESKSTGLLKLCSETGGLGLLR